MKRLLPILFALLLAGPSIAQSPTAGYNTNQIKDGAIQRHNVNTTKSGQALPTKIVAGSGISLGSTGVDAGTGDVTISATATGVISVNSRTGAITLLGTDLPVFAGAGTGHGPGTVPDPGAAAGLGRFLSDSGAWLVPSGSGTVTSIGLSAPSLLYSVSGSPVTSSGTITETLLTQTANRILAGPASGAAATPSFRALVPLDLPAATTTTLGTVQLAGDLAGTATSPALATVGTAGTAGDATHTSQITFDAKGRVTSGTSIAITYPVTSVNSRTGAVTLGNTDIGSEPALGNPAATGYILSSTATGTRSWITPPASGVTSVNTRTGAVTLIGTDLPVFAASGTGHSAGAVPDPGATAGTTRFLREDGGWAAIAGGAGGTVTSVGLAMPSVFSVTGSPVTGSGTLSVTYNAQAANTVLAGPSSGAAATPTFRALAGADLPASGAGAAAYGFGHSATIDTTGRVTSAANPTGTASSTTYLRGDGSWATPAAGGSSTLAGDSDVAISGPASGQVLIYNGAAWANATPVAGGGGGVSIVSALPTASSAIRGQFYLVGTGSQTDQLYVGVKVASGAYQYGLITPAFYTSNYKPALNTPVDTGLSISSGLVYSAPWYEGSGTIFYDRTASPTNGTLASSSMWVNDSTYGTVLAFSGGSASIPNASKVNTETYSIAFAFRSSQTAYTGVFAKVVSATYTYAAFMSNNGSGILDTPVYNGSQQPNPVSSASVADGNWHKAVITRAQGGTMRLYIDGILQSQVSDTTSAGSTLNTAAIQFGGGVNGSGSFTGSLAYWHMWNRVLTGAPASVGSAATGEIAALATDEFAMYR